VKTFALPDLRGRTGVSQGVGSTGTQYVVGKNGGAESVAVTVAQLPTHTHVFQGTKADATINAPAGSLLATVTGGQSAYAPYSATSQTTLTPASIGSAGSSAAHENRQPYLALNFCIAAQGTYPQRP
jgi:microcystin-dependent protein